VIHELSVVMDGAADLTNETTFDAYLYFTK
jgi:hypothetical protein